MSVKFLCDDCGVDVMTLQEHYMVKNEIWPRGVRFLCIGCLEARLGRRLKPRDFMDVPLNSLFSHSERLADRLGFKSQGFL